ncbi:hypothetical protein [Salinigranum marinum]|uniref:hypothetical protein n=1 Tax=Salinigranum marinum TaxID=1515595 RepID=UPI00298A03BC|nr:hypothetical protein [Salinigranum marinum]
MAESVLVPFVAASVGAVGVATALFALYSRSRPGLLQGPMVVAVSLLATVAGVVVLLVGEAAHGAGSLVYVGGFVALVGVGALTGIVATVSYPEGANADAGH